VAGLAELAAALRRADRELETHGAIDCAHEAGQAYLVQLRLETPVLTGELRASERVDSVRGGGTSAVATIGAHKIYAAFRETGGTITSHGSWPLRNAATGQVFGHSVTQAGSHYFEHATARAGPAIQEACEKVITKILRDAGL
jgi:hypothetical protein